MKHCYVCNKEMTPKGVEDSFNFNNKLRSNENICELCFDEFLVHCTRPKSDGVYSEDDWAIVCIDCQLKVVGDRLDDLYWMATDSH